MSEVHEGGCLCGRVRYRVTGAPRRTLVCHCSFCQKMTGSSSYAESMFPIGAVRFTGDPTSLHSHRSDESGKLVHVNFCPGCGTTVALTFERWPELCAISRGSFDDPNWAHVDAHIWTRSAQEGTALPSGTDCFKRSLVTLDGTPEVPDRFDEPVKVGGREQA